MRLDPFICDISQEEITTLALPDSPSYKLTLDEVEMSDNTPIVIKYDYADLDVTKYNFKQHFTDEDTAAYFEKMKFISSKKIS